MSVVVNNISKLYKSQRALDNVSFELNSGQVLGFLGPNGAGKSTMMKILSCYLPQNAGSATVCGFDVNAQSLEVRRILGYLPEHNPLYLDMYVKEYLGFVAGLHHIRHNVCQRVNEMISMTGLGAEQKKKIGALSKGYRQRVGLAQALIHDPKVLILDEPTSGLDPNQLVEIRELIKNIGREKTVILSTHIMQEVEAMCKRVIIINKGKIVADDDTSILQKRSNKQGQAILVEVDINLQAEIWQAISQINSAQAIGNNNWELKSLSDEDFRPQVFQLAVDKGFKVLAMQKQQNKLEDIFHELTAN